MTPSEKLQLQEALIKYKQTHGIKGQHYWLTILQKLKLDTVKKIVDGKEIKPKLHERDPRHWITDGIEPGEAKLRVYLDFIKTVYPNFEFRPSLTEEYIQIGLTLARFSIGQAAADDPRLHKEAKKLDGNIYLSKSCPQNLDDQDEFCRILSLQVVPGSPFMVVRRFCLTNLMWLYGAECDLADFLPTFYASTSENAHNNLRKLAELLSGSIENLMKENVTSIKCIYRGIISPTGVSNYYHGILQSSNFLPDHVSYRFSEGSDTKAPLAHETSQFWDSPSEYVRCDGLKTFEGIFSTIGEPRL